MLRSLGVLAASLTAAAAIAPVQAAPGVRISYHRWASASQLAQGTAQGAAVQEGRLVIGRAAGTARLDGTGYEWARWTSPEVTPGFDLTELVPSWTARTPGSTGVKGEVRGTTAAGTATGWDTSSRW